MSDTQKAPIILSVRNLKVSFKTDEGLVHAVRGVSFDLYKGETLCIVGESGSGKSVTSKTIMGILPASAVIEDGSAIFEGEDLTKIDETEFHRIRGHKIGMIFQDPLSSLNPIMKVGKQITEAMLVNHNRIARMYDNLISRQEADYKNNAVILKSAIIRANQSVVESDASFDQKIAALTRSVKEKKNALNPKAPHFDVQKTDFEVFSKVIVGEKKTLMKEKMEAHQRLAKQAKVATKAAKAEYRKNKPMLCQALKIAKASAKEQIAKFKKDRKAEYEVRCASFDAEEKTLKETFDKKIAEQKKGFASAPSQITAKKVLVDTIAEKNGRLAELKNRRIQAKNDYVALFKITHREARKEALKVMKEVGIPQPEMRFKQYPFEFSGGMRQRIVIAIALTANPKVLICDEPTTALDVTIQAQILELINRLKKERNMSVIFITHDLGVVANMADRVAVMYAGKIVEVGTVNEIFYDPRHPYTWALLSSIPDLDSKEKLEAIPGTPPYLLNPPQGDAFAPRNKYALAVDFEKEPPFFKITETHYAATWLLDGRAPKAEKPKIVTTRINASLERAGVKNESELENKK
jgi:oligopeptide transport system ATP-binding protein